MTPGSVADTLLLSGRKPTGVVARLALRVFFAMVLSLSVPQKDFLASVTGLVTTLWLRVLRGVSVGVAARLRALLSRSEPQNLLSLGARLMERDFLGWLRAGRGSGGVRGLNPAGADCLRGRTLSTSFRGSVKADRCFAVDGFGVEVRLLSNGEDLPEEVFRLTGEVVEALELCTGETVEERVKARSTGEILPEEALLIGESFPLEGAGESFPLEGVGESFPVEAAGDSEAGGGGRGRSAPPRRPCVTRRTWHGSWRDRKCSSVSQPPPTRTIM